MRLTHTYNIGGTLSINFILLGIYNAIEIIIITTNNRAVQSY